MNRILLALALACPLWALAGPVEPGQPLPALSLKNQHDQEWYVHADTRLVIFAAGRKASNLAMAVLGPQPKGFLAARHALYLADMSRMPGFITRTFALPSLKEQPFEVGVVLDDKTLAGWPRQDDALTLIRLDNGRVVSHEYATTEVQLKAALGL
ncbi:MAG: hypothetical protein JNK17_11210 [Hydrogenophaga sp.]|uniref:hypothetical protein n=1 Tax=Hydrogenophaga sp. TaxID=1904254 RepID=UPI001A638F9D|nr:hypothetical protein [Hydrogenophaga sp.]